MFTAWQVFLTDFFVIFVTVTIFMTRSKEPKLAVFIATILAAAFYSELLVLMLCFIGWVWIK